MNPSPRWRLAATAALVLALGMAVREVRRAYLAHERLTALDILNRDTQARIDMRHARQRPSGASPLPAAPPSATPAPATLPGPTDATLPAPRTMGRVVLTRPWLSRVFAENPTIQALYLDAYRKDIELRYAPIFRLLNLSREEASQLVAILAKDMEASSDIGATARTKDIPSIDPAIRHMNEQRKREREEALRSLLGPERMMLWGESGFRQLNVTNAMSQLVARLHATSTPLTSGQADQLTAALDSPALRASATELPLLDPAAYDRLIAQSASILTPPQLQVFQSLIEAQRARVALHEAMRSKKR